VQVQSLIAQCLFICLAVVLDTMGRVLVMFMFQLHTVDLRMLSMLPQQTLLSVCLGPLVCRSLQALGKGLRLRQTIEEGPAV
jgi:hypothetical protein